MAMKKVEVTEIKPIEMATRKIRIVGDSPLIMHAWSQKAKQMILDKQMGKAKAKGHDIKNPVEDFIDSMYWLEGKPTEMTEDAFNAAVENGARWGFPVTAIKQATAMASSRNDLGIPGTKIKGSFFIKGYGPDQCVEIKGCVPTIREDMVRVGMGSADIRFRGQFDIWYADLELTYNVNGSISFEQIVNLINLGGFCCGIGEWRPEKDGSFGMYHIATDD